MDAPLPCDVMSGICLSCKHFMKCPFMLKEYVRRRSDEPWMDQMARHLFALRPQPEPRAYDYLSVIRVADDALLPHLTPFMKRDIETRHTNYFVRVRETSELFFVKMREDLDAVRGEWRAGQFMGQAAGKHAVTAELYFESPCGTQQRLHGFLVFRYLPIYTLHRLKAKGDLPPDAPDSLTVARAFVPLLELFASACVLDQPQWIHADLHHKQIAIYQNALVLMDFEHLWHRPCEWGPWIQARTDSGFVHTHAKDVKALCEAIAPLLPKELSPLLRERAKGQSISALYMRFSHALNSLQFP